MSTLPSSGHVVSDKYLLEKPLGEGGMGSVFLATHQGTGRKVAVKLVSTSDSAIKERVLREARAMGRLSHPNVVGVLDVGEHEGCVFMVMEYKHGTTLRTFMERRVFEPAAAIGLLMPALSGVAAAHQAGILHRDLKPENLFVCLDEKGAPLTTVVLDFGIAKEILEDAEASLTQTGTIIGTPKYMAPEQLGATGNLDERTDVYALAVILYELLTGRLPHQGTGLRSVAIEVLRGDFPDPREYSPELPPDLCLLVMTALSLQPDRRPASVERFARALEAWGHGASFAPPRDIHTPGLFSLEGAATVTLASPDTVPATQLDNPQGAGAADASSKHAAPSADTSSALDTLAETDPRPPPTRRSGSATAPVASRTLPEGQAPPGSGRTEESVVASSHPGVASRWPFAIGAGFALVVFNVSAAYMWLHRPTPTTTGHPAEPAPVAAPDSTDAVPPEGMAPPSATQPTASDPAPTVDAPARGEKAPSKAPEARTAPRHRAARTATDTNQPTPSDATRRAVRPETTTTHTATSAPVPSAAPEKDPKPMPAKARAGTLRREDF